MEDNMTLMETFKLYLWVCWKSGFIDDWAMKKILAFMDSLTEKETVAYCMNQLEELKNGVSVEVSRETGGKEVGGLSEN